MLMKDRFKELMPEISSIKRISEDGEVYWKVFDDEKTCIGYAFFIVAPETDDPSLDVEEFDKYEVTGTVDTDFEITALDISEHPDGPDDLWAKEVIEPEFATQYLRLNPDEMHLSPDGKIDAVSDGTLSSKILSDGIRNKLEQIKAAA